MDTVIRYVEVISPWVSAKDAGKLINQKNPSEWLKRFRDFADDNPHVFKPYKPYTSSSKRDTGYSPVALGFYYEYSDVLEASTRSIKLADEEERLRIQYLGEKITCI